jgi:phage FluMu protein Com
MPLTGNLKCNNGKCGATFLVLDFQPNISIKCPRCGSRSQYRSIDFIRENRSETISVAALCKRVADSHFDEKIRSEALGLWLEWTALQLPRSTDLREEGKAAAKRKANRERMEGFLRGV